MNIKPISVSQLNNYIKRLISTDFLLNSIDVEGEISNYKKHSSGTIYFSLKDSESKISCIIFKNSNSKTEFEDGMKVIISGAVSVYDKEGVYQIIVDEISPIGGGKLYEDFIKLKSKLEKEGLFKESSKKELPMISKKVALITSDTGATIKDMIINIKRRNDSINIVVYPSIMQGLRAPESVIKSLKDINERDDIDVIIIGRGGGAIEDLSAFNNEDLAREIYNSKIPIISAIGHETDFTICDFVADKRASTPSVAAELVSKKKTDILLELDNLVGKLEKEMEEKITKTKYKLSTLEKFLGRENIYKNISNYRGTLKNLLFRIREVAILDLYENKIKLEKEYEKLISLNPKNILSRGYVMIEDEDKKIIKTKKELENGKTIKICFRDGDIKLRNIQLGDE